MAKHLEVGKLGEDAAAKHLEECGYTILERNWRYSRAEIDIISKKEEILVFTEVKTRSNIQFGPPHAFVDEKKENLMLDAASRYMELINHQWEIRFDIISIIISKDEVVKIELIKDAFFPSWE